MAPISEASIRCSNMLISLESRIQLFKHPSHRLVCSHQCSSQQHNNNNKAKNKHFHHRNKVNLILRLYPSSRATTTTTAMSEELLMFSSFIVFKICFQMQNIQRIHTLCVGCSYLFKIHIFIWNHVLEVSKKIIYFYVFWCYLFERDRNKKENAGFCIAIASFTRCTLLHYCWCTKLRSWSWAHLLATTSLSDLFWSC